MVSRVQLVPIDLETTEDPVLKKLCDPGPYANELEPVPVPEDVKNVVATPYSSESAASVTGILSTRESWVSAVLTPFAPISTHAGGKDQTTQEMDMDHPLQNTVVEPVASIVELYGG
ncbi:hypothetical protein COOONC_12026 [Cooperia oncophora]